MSAAPVLASPSLSPPAGVAGPRAPKPADAKAGLAALAAVAAGGRAPDGRPGAVLRRLTDAFLDQAPSLSDAGVGLFDEVILTLAPALSVPARAELAEALAAVPNAPVGVVRLLAYDDNSAVATPVIARSARLVPFDLLAIAARKSLDHLLAMTGRPDLTPTVTDIMIFRGNREVIRSVAANEAAPFSLYGHGRLADEARFDDALRHVLRTRGDVPTDTSERLMEAAGEKTRLHLLDVFGPDAARRIDVAVRAALSALAAQGAFADTLGVATDNAGRALEAVPAAARSIAGMLWKRDAEEFVRAADFVGLAQHGSHRVTPRPTPEPGPGELMLSDLGLTGAAPLPRPLVPGNDLAPLAGRVADAGKTDAATLGAAPGLGADGPAALPPLEAAASDPASRPAAALAGPEASAPTRPAPGEGAPAGGDAGREAAGGPAGEASSPSAPAAAAAAPAGRAPAPDLAPLGAMPPPSGVSLGKLARARFETELDLALDAGDLEATARLLAGTLGLSPAIATEAMRAPTLDGLLVIFRASGLEWSHVRRAIAAKFGGQAPMGLLERVEPTYQRFSRDAALRALRVVLLRSRDAADGPGGDAKPSAAAE